MEETHLYCFTLSSLLSQKFTRKAVFAQHSFRLFTLQSQGMALCSVLSKQIAKPQPSLVLRSS